MNAWDWNEIGDMAVLVVVCIGYAIVGFIG